MAYILVTYPLGLFWIKYIANTECRDGGGTGNAIANVESDGEENAEEKSDEQECDEERQNCFDIIPEIKEIIPEIK